MRACPPGVWNLVNGLGEEAGKALTEHPDIKAIAFVGESKTGSMIMAQGAPTLKRVHFELGGKNPVVVFDDADLERALDAAIFMIYSLNGERCTSSSRLLIQDSIAEDFETKLIARVNSIKVGHPLDPKTEVGPLIHKVHFDKVTSYFDIARQDGATVAAGGSRHGDTGWFVSPTLFTGATNQMTIAREEIFGPVLTAIRFADEDEALNIANIAAKRGSRAAIFRALLEVNRQALGTDTRVTLDRIDIADVNSARFAIDEVELVSFNLDRATLAAELRRGAERQRRHQACGQNK